MSKRFRCGRLIVKLDGTTKRLDLGNGGGSRFFVLDHNDMRFTDVHYCLLNIFNLRGRKHETSLYDFARRPINFKQYATFGEYINKNGLNGNSTIIYLCTREANEIDEPRPLMMIKRNSLSIKPSTFNQQTFTRSETEYEHVVRNKSDSLDYSFKTSSNELMGNIGDLINRNSFDIVLIQILEYICIIHGYVSSTIEPLIQQMQQSNEYFQSINQSERMLYSNSLNDVYDICQSAETLLHRNKNKFGHIQIFSTITNSFSHFYEQLKTVRNQWLGNSEDNNNTISISSSFTHSNIEVISLQDQCEIKLENSRESSHSYQTPPSSDVFEPLSLFQESSDKRINEQSSLFQPVLSHLRDLLHLLNPQGLSSFQKLVQSSIDKIKFVRTSINLNDEQSMCDGKRVILSIKTQFVEKSSELHNNQRKSSFDRKIIGLCKNTLRAINFLFTTLYGYQLEAQKHNELNGSNRLSSSLSFIDLEHCEDKQSIQLNKRKFENDDDDDHYHYR